MKTSDLSVSFRDIDFDSDEDCGQLAVWLNQDAQALSLAPKNQETLHSIRAAQKARAQVLYVSEKFFICVNAEPVGYASFLVDPSHKLSNERVVWPSLTIGDRRFRRQGLARKVGAEMSRRAKKHGATHIEAGVFDTNAPMIALLEKHGFTPIGKQLVGPEKRPSLHFVRPLLEEQEH